MNSVLLTAMVLSSMVLHSSTIEALKSTAEVEAFIRTYAPKISQDPTKFRIKPTDELASEMDCDGRFETWGIKNWEKADLNNDGRTDLLVIGHWYGTRPLVVLDLGDAHFRFIRLPGQAVEGCQLFKPIKVKGQTLIKTYTKVPKKQTNPSWDAVRYQTDTLAFLNNTLITYNAKPANTVMTSISLRTTPCFGSCPVFHVTLLPDDTALFEGQEHTPLIGKHKLSLQAGTFQRLETLLNYMDLSKLKRFYAVPWTDDQTATLEITTANGNSIRIEDYGMQGTLGLEAVYQTFSAIVASINHQ